MLDVVLSTLHCAQCIHVDRLISRWLPKINVQVFPMKFSSNAVSVDLNFMKNFFDLLFIEFLSIPLKDLLQEYNRFAYQKVFILL